MTLEKLNQAFKMYFDEMDRCVRQGCYWALLHLSIVLPDICAALESEDGQGKPDRYKNWCKRYLADRFMSPSDWYSLRCALLHQGQTTSIEGRHRSFSLSSPDSGTGVRLHKVAVPSEGNITLDIGKVADEVRESIERWFRDLQNPEQMVTLRISQDTSRLSPKKSRRRSLESLASSSGL